MTCFDVLLDLQFNNNFYRQVFDHYYNWYERRVSEVVNERGIVHITLSEFHTKADICRILHKKFGFDYDTIAIGLENIQQYCKEMEVECRVSSETFGMAVAARYFEEHEVPYMYRGANNTVNFSKSIDFVSWTTVSEVFNRMYGLYLDKSSEENIVSITVSMFDEFVAPELLRVKSYCRAELFNAFTDWLIETFDNVVIEDSCVTFISRPYIANSVDVGA